MSYERRGVARRINTSSGISRLDDEPSQDFFLHCILILALRLAMKEIPRAGFLKDFMMKHGKPYCLSSR